MVLEHLFPEDWLERKLRYAFLLAVVYSLISIAVARLLFPANRGIVSIIFASLLLMPYMKKLLLREERKELKEKRFTLKRFWLDNKDSIKVYFTIFLGIYFTYLAYTFIAAYFGGDVSSIFREQLSLEANVRGGAFSFDTFLSIFLNNWWVLLACFFLALTTGDGAIFFIAWNASSWGTIFGFRAVEAAINGGAFGAWTNLLLIVVITLPHVLIEGGAYILAAISGGVLSDDIVGEKRAMYKFLLYLIAAVILFIVLFILLEMILADFKLIARLLEILIVVITLHALGFVFEKKQHMEVFHYNYYLFVVAVAVFLLGAIVETLVITSPTLFGLIQNPLLHIYWAALG